MNVQLVTHNSKLLFFLFTLFLLVACKPKDKPSSTATLTDDALMDAIQRRTFSYSWGAAEPNSGLARGCYHMDGEHPAEGPEIVTSGGSGFGIVAILVGIDRGYISREEGLRRMERIIRFPEKANYFKGAYPRWWNGETECAQPFGQENSGGDLVETVFLMQGLLAIYQYYAGGSTEEKALAARIDKLWQEVDWNWYRHNGRSVFYWHWSPGYGQEMNFPVHDYNEYLVMYILAAASSIHGVPAAVCHERWAQNGVIVSPHRVGGIELHLRYQGGEVGPLLWTQYSFLGLDPVGLKDEYCPSYFSEIRSLALVDHGYCTHNPKHYKGYRADCWGLTASCSVGGCVAHGPLECNDRGVIFPTAALSSTVYTPDQSLQMIHHLYQMGDKVFDPYGFYDAFSETTDQYPKRYLTIDQGPVTAIIESYQTRLLWKFFMSHPDVQNELKKLGFNVKK